jgi:hypothetical protein
MANTGRFFSRKKPGNHYTGGWVGLRFGLDGHEKSRTLVFDPLIVQAVAGRYTDYAISAAYLYSIFLQY